MSVRYDVFLSHNSADKPSVEKLAARLEDEEGLKPFLDKWHLIPGEPWEEALEEALDSSAACAVFLGESGLGPWENEEMRSALDERVHNKSFRVIPVLLPGADPKRPITLPRFLRRLTWVDFRSGLEDPEAFRYLVAGIRGKAPGRGIIATVSKSRFKPEIIYLRTSALRHPYSFLLLTLPTLVIIIAYLVLSNWHISTKIQAELTANRATFTVGGTDEIPILDSISFQSLTIRKFDRIKLNHKKLKLEVADPAQFILREGRYPQSAWRPLKVIPPVVITGKDKSLQPKVKLESAEPGPNTAGSLKQFWVKPGAEVTIEVLRGTPTVNLLTKVDGRESYVDLFLQEQLQLTTTQVLISHGITVPYQADSLTYKIQVLDENQNFPVEITGQPSSLELILRIPSEKTSDLFPNIGIPIKDSTDLEFSRQSEYGKYVVSALVKDGEITYPDYPRREKVKIKSSDLIELKSKDLFHIEKITTTPEHKGIYFRLYGVASYIKISSSHFSKDRRLTLFDTLWQNPQLTVLFSIITWVFSTTVVAYKLYKDIMG